MTVEQAMIWNAAIEEAAKKYLNGLGAILQLKKQFVVTVEHIGTTTKQNVDVME